MRRGTPKLRLLSCDAALQVIQARMPLRQGGGAFSRVPLLYVRVQIELKDGKSARGLAAGCLPPPGPASSSPDGVRRHVEEQLAAFRKARELYLSASDKPLAASEIWESVHPRLLEKCGRLGIGPLEASLGGSFLERALIDALCRAREVSFFEALEQNLLGMDTAWWPSTDSLGSVRCRHVVGLFDPLVRGEIPSGERLDDGLPQSLEDEMDFYGFSSFKVELGGDHERDVERLSRIAPLVHQRCKAGYDLALDGGEKYADLAAVERLIESLRSKPYGAQFIDALRHIEQPLPREIALEPSAAPAIARLSGLKPLVIDESDGTLDSFERAAAVGYAGTTHRSGGGIFKSLRNRAWILQANRERKKQRLAPLFQAGDDFSSVAVLPLQQDLAVFAALGIESADRRGHRHFRGLDHLPPREASSALALHSDIYEERDGSVFLRIQNGEIRIRSLQAPGFGYRCEIAFDERAPVESWSLDELEEPTHA